MESKKGFGKQLEQIIEGRGFYIVMALCAAIIGVSIWSLLKTPAPTMDESEFDEVLSDVETLPYDPIAPEITAADIEEPNTSAEETDNANISDSIDAASSENVVWPLTGTIQREYSMDRLQYDATMADWRTHDGLDLQAEKGTGVSAIRSGTVLNVYTDDLYGPTVVIDHGNGLICAYSNLDNTPKVSNGDAVKAGDIIGLLGESVGCEAAQESHLHLSAKLNGQSVSPMDYLPQKG